MKIRYIWIIPIVAGLFLTATLQTSGSAESHYWGLGVGSYGAGAGKYDTWTCFTELDRARYDWVYLTFGNPPEPCKETTEMLNRFLKINPNLKIMVRVWPITGLGAKENRYLATFLDYLYKEGIKEKILERISSQIHSVLDYIDKPENVLGFTFLEELPFHFADKCLDILDEDTLSWSLKLYRKEIEKERGKPLKWDEDTRRWWGKKFVQVLNEINGHIKKESGGKWVFVYLQANHTTLDDFPNRTDLRKWHLLPFHYSDVIKPGCADGFFAYPNNEYIWKRYISLATKNNWLFFSQLPHPGVMRLCGWQKAIQLVETKVPQNLGYFFYCSGDCRQHNWNDDKSIPVDDNSRPKSIRSHHRRFLAQRNVGMDILHRCLIPRIHLQYNSESIKVGIYTAFRVRIQNLRDASWYLKAEDAVLKNVKLTIELPEEFTIDPIVSQPAHIEIGDIGSGEYTNAIWWAMVKAPIIISEKKPVRITLSADNCDSVTVTEYASKAVIPPL